MIKLEGSSNSFSCENFGGFLKDKNIFELFSIFINVGKLLVK